MRRGAHWSGIGVILPAKPHAECEQERHQRIPLLATFSLWDSVDRALVIFPQILRRRPVEHGHERECRVIRLSETSQHGFSRNCVENANPVKRCHNGLWVKLCLSTHATHGRHTHTLLSSIEHIGVVRWLAPRSQPSAAPWSVDV